MMIVGWFLFGTERVLELQERGSLLEPGSRGTQEMDPKPKRGNNSAQSVGKRGGTSLGKS
jgi:hypothetical protein